MANLSMALPTRSSRPLQHWFWIFLVLNIVFIFWSRHYLSPQLTNEIIKFEIAKKVPVAENIVREWKIADDGSFDKAIQGIYLDYLFIILYATGLSIACVFLSQLTRHQILQRAGRFFQFLVIGAGICDIIENIAMLNSLQGHLNGWNVLVAYDMALTKFSLILLSLLFLMICVIFFVLRKVGK